MYLGMSGRDPSSASCEDMVVRPHPHAVCSHHQVRIHLPGTAYADIQLDVEDTVLDLRAPAFRLSLPLPHRVDSKTGRAQWDAGAGRLDVTLRVLREYDFLRQY
jgi:hypothetical protein